ncbi:MAG: hypothetical protein H6Q62_195 [Firmicutes bacterium]|nr:hypothetical protein [Bacillota bacterium]
MSVLERIACQQNRKDDVPNQELARDLATRQDLAGIREIANNLFNRDQNIQSDCIKVLYEIGYLDPGLIENHFGDFLKLLHSGNNRLNWGAMLALSTIASLKADEIFSSIDLIFQTMQSGSVITIDNSVKVLAAVAAHRSDYNKSIFPYLLEHLKTCRPKEVAQHAESIMVAVRAHRENRSDYLDTLKDREKSLTSAQLARVKKLYKLLQD